MKNSDLIKNRITEMCTHILFDYNGKPCGIDPLSKSEIEMWYGERYYTASSIDDAMAHRLFDGKSLTDIADAVQNLEL